MEQEKLDNLMLELDGTENKCKQGPGEDGETEGTHEAERELKGPVLWKLPEKGLSED